MENNETKIKKKKWKEQKWKNRKIKNYWKVLSPTKKGFQIKFWYFVIWLDFWGAGEACKTIENLNKMKKKKWE